MEAVPILSILPPDVIGLPVPTLAPCSAVVSAPLPELVPALFVPGLIYPVTALPEFDIGRMFYEIPPFYAALDNGLEKDVPGLGAFATALSSKRKIKNISHLSQYA